MSVERVRRAVAAAVPGWFGPGAVTTWPIAPTRHTWSYQFRPEVVTTDGAVARLVVKVPVWEEAPTLAEALAAGPQDDTRAEASMLEGIAASIGGDGLAAVGVRGYLPEINAIVMDHFDGRPLRSLVGDPRRWTGLPEVFARVGRWLRAYHDDVAGVSVDPFAPGSVMAQVEFAFVALGGRALDEAFVRVRCALKGLAGRPVRMTRTHGDFTLANVLVSSEGAVAGLDPNRYEGPAVADLARLIVDVRTHRLRSATFGAMPSSSRLALWEEALLGGYGDVDAEVLAALVAVTSLQRLQEAETAGGGLLRRLGAPLQRRLLTAEAARAASRLKRLRTPQP